MIPGAISRFTAYYVNKELVSCVKCVCMHACVRTCVHACMMYVCVCVFVWVTSFKHLGN